MELYQIKRKEMVKGMKKEVKVKGMKKSIVFWYNESENLRQVKRFKTNIEAQRFAEELKNNNHNYMINIWKGEQ